MNIRPLRETDAQAINDLSEQLGYPYPLEKTKAKINYAINHVDHWVYVAETSDTGKILGYIHLALFSLLFYDNMVNILGLVVDEDARGTGLGAALIKVAERTALENGCSKVRAASGMMRSHAHEFYIKHGFYNQKDQKRFIKELKS
ncbi:MAG: GNAT family N-acetyltransferase [Bacteroidota bacterium]